MKKVFNIQLGAWFLSETFESDVNFLNLTAKTTGIWVWEDVKWDMPNMVEFPRETFF